MSLISFAAYPQQIEQYSVKKINTSITVDGYLDEDAWSAADPTKDFVILGNNQTAAKTTTWAKILWDENYLYVGFYCEDTKIWATYQNQDDPLYEEDVVEVYIDPDGDGEKYLEVEVNPLNTIFDLWLTKPWSEGGQGNTEWTMAGLITAISVDGTVSDNSDQDHSWICEMAMPFTEMAFAAGQMNFPPLENDRWRFNMYRFDRRSTGDPDGEATGWSQTSGGQHEPGRFGEIIFTGPSTDMPQVGAENNTIGHFLLHQNYPNPFNPLTTFKYSIPKSANVNLTLNDLLGQEILILVNQKQVAGSYQVKFDAGNLSSGIYLYTLEAGDYRKTKRMMLLK
jgi:hypothetical protein